MSTPASTVRRDPGRGRGDTPRSTAAHRTAAPDTAVCDPFDLDGLRHFVSTWFDDTRAEPVE
jgi:hypothetical protein